MDLINPVTFGAKLQWLKLFYRDPDIPRCSDKYELKNYLAERGFGEHCIETIGIYNSANEIDFDSLPQQFAAKATHGSGWNLICKDKSSLNWKNSVRLMNSWLKLNLYVFGREWNYKEIQPRIIVEKFLSHEPLYDYKYLCFQGEPKILQLNNDFNGVHYVDFYDISTWKHLPFTHDKYIKSDRNMKKPEQFDEMLQLAREISKPFPFVRVDFYSFDGMILVGELTFFPSGGLLPYVPIETGYNEIVGSYLHLPAPNHNLALYQKMSKRRSS